MKCPQCQHDNPQQAKFCLDCGARFALSCVNCGTELPADAKFYLECGQQLTQSDGTGTEVTPKYASPETYTPKYLAERILTSKASLEGERKQVTVLFAGRSDASGRAIHRLRTL